VRGLSAVDSVISGNWRLVSEERSVGASFVIVDCEMNHLRKGRCCMQNGP
jgi:hypothetical protein